MKTPLLSDREADSADYLTAAEILKGQRSCLGSRDAHIAARQRRSGRRKGSGRARFDAELSLRLLRECGSAADALQTSAHCAGNGVR